MAIDLVADTHAILWYLYDDRRLSAVALRQMEAVEQAGNKIAIASITLAEIVYLMEKGQFARSLLIGLSQGSKIKTRRSWKFRLTGEWPSRCVESFVPKSLIFRIELSRQRRCTSVSPW